MAFALPPRLPNLRRTKVVTGETAFRCAHAFRRQMRFRMTAAGAAESKDACTSIDGKQAKDVTPLSYCRRCATQMIERTPPGDEHVRSVCPKCNLIAYENPKVVVGCVPVSQDRKRVLLAKRAIPPVGKWTFPAGFLENGETAERGAAREAWEEARAELDMSPITLLAVYNILPAKQVQLLYRSTLLNEESVAPGVESQVVRMFEWKDIPWDDLAFPTVKWALEYSYQHRDALITLPQLKDR